MKYSLLKITVILSFALLAFSVYLIVDYGSRPKKAETAQERDDRIISSFEYICSFNKNITTLNETILKCRATNDSIDDCIKLAKMSVPIKFSNNDARLHSDTRQEYDDAVKSARLLLSTGKQYDGSCQITDNPVKQVEGS